MHANFNYRLSLGAFFQGQGTQNAVELAAGAAARAFATHLASKLSRGFSLRHGLWQAHLLKRLPAVAMPAMCPISDRRRQRVVVTRGTVGVV